MLPNITFIKGQGGLGRPLPGQDFISALIFYTNSLPSGFSSGNRIKSFFAVADAESAGILNDYSDATAATGSYLINSIGNTGDVIEIESNDIDNQGNPLETILCTYVQQASDTTIALMGPNIAAAINAGTQNHGYSAVFSVATLTITAPKRLGTFLNTNSPITVEITGSITGTITQFSGGAFSALAFYHYHISEFFRVQPQGVLYVGFFAVPGSYTYSEINTVQNFANGSIRQVGVYKDVASNWAEGDLTLIDTACKTSDTAHKPISAIYAADLTSVNDISTLPDLSLLTANKAAAVIGQDAGGTGFFLHLTSGKSVNILGATLGAIALSKVSESIGWLQKFNMSDGSEDEVLGFANGQVYNNSSITQGLDNLQSFLNDKRYIFLRKFIGIAGSYFNDSNCAISDASDYAQIENNRTIDKSIRGIYSSLLPSLNSPLQLNDDGTLSETTTAALESQASTNLDQMVRDAELSDFSVVINPDQNVLATSKIIVTVSLLINGVARQIQVNIGFVTKIS